MNKQVKRVFKIVNIFLKSPFNKIIISILIAALFIGSSFGSGSLYKNVYALSTETSVSDVQSSTIRNYVRFAGKDRYSTAIEISRNNWLSSSSVVIARGDAFPDALAGAILANSAEVKGPLLLTEPGLLRPEVLAELKRLNTSMVYILGGTGAIAQGVEEELRSNGMQVTRISGQDRYETAANIVSNAVTQSDSAFIASGEGFADALSISSYAAAHGIPLLLTTKNELSAAALKTLQDFGVTKVTLVGGEGVIAKSLEDKLRQAGYTVDRLSGSDRYLTNAAILKNFGYNTDDIYVATGQSFPDALAGSALAARNNNPIVLVPQNVSRIPGTLTSSYLDDYREGVDKYFILGGSGAVSYAIESYVTTGITPKKISLQFWDGYSSRSEYEKQLASVPGNLTDSIHILTPNFAGELQNDGSFGYTFPSADIPKYLVALGQSKGAKVVPMVLADKQLANNMLYDPAKRLAFADSVVKMINETNADGVVIDLEALAEYTEEGLTELMRDIYGRLNPKGKIVIVSVMSRTSKTAEPWYSEYNYHELGKYSDYVQIMSYDLHWSNSVPGPVASADWVRKVMSYAVAEIPPEKILMGIPYFGRSWRTYGYAWTSFALGSGKAAELARQKNAVVYRETTPSDPIGIPTYRYIDENGCTRTVYYDDRLSIGVKLTIVDQYGLAGIGGWAMRWLTDGSSQEIYPLIKDWL